MNMFLNVFNTKFFSTECGSFKNHCHSLLSDLSDFQLQGLGFLSILDSRYHSTGGGADRWGSGGSARGVSTGGDHHRSKVCYWSYIRRPPKKGRLPKWMTAGHSCSAPVQLPYYLCKIFQTSMRQLNIQHTQKITPNLWLTGDMCLSWTGGESTNVSIDQTSMRIRSSRARYPRNWLVGSPPAAWRMRAWPPFLRWEWWRVHPPAALQWPDVLMAGSMEAWNIAGKTQGKDVISPVLNCAQSLGSWILCQWNLSDHFEIISILLVAACLSPGFSKPLGFPNDQILEVQMSIRAPGFLRWDRKWSLTTDRIPLCNQNNGRIFC